MKRVKIRAGLYLAATALYIWMAAILDRLGLCMPTVFALAVGFLCGYNCLLCGMDIERWRRIRQEAEETETMAAALESKHVRCGNCGCDSFRLIAGREVCNCCGEVRDDGT